ncbi:MAG: SO_0444 family Cu/Zn efflux transporter [Pseudomonadales bacterium]|nr:SO_0444 family Cu/Zn efflux transporter [Pseudomonadales bacterium]
MMFLTNFLELSLEAAPWLVFGLLLGGLVGSVIPRSFLERHLSGNGLGSILKATVLGAPLPLCSCGVIPAALGLRKAGASKPATAAFLVSTPETGVDSISVTYALLGPVMAVVRPVAALCSAITAGVLVALFDRDDKHNGTVSDESSTSCCASKAKQQAVQPEAEESCCASSGKTELQKNGLLKVWADIQTTFTDLLDSIGLWLLAGLVFAAAVQTFLPATFLSAWGQGFIAMGVMVLVGIPMYICATASTPIAAGLVIAGVSPGVALVLLLTGPATNLSTLGVISQELGKRSMWLYLLAVASTAMLAGWLVNALFTLYEIDIQAQVHAVHVGVPIWLQWGALLLLLAVAFYQNIIPRLANR